jgi:hypothetical protein
VFHPFVHDRPHHKKCTVKELIKREDISADFLPPCRFDYKRAHKSLTTFWRISSAVQERELIQILEDIWRIFWVMIGDMSSLGRRTGWDACSTLQQYNSLKADLHQQGGF